MKVYARILFSFLCILLLPFEPLEFQEAAAASKNTVITISAVGDCTIGEDETLDEHPSFNEIMKSVNNNYNYCFENVKSILGIDDLTIANLETTFTYSSDKAQKKYRFKGKPEYVNILKSGSIEAVNISNNHTYDYLKKGFNDTLSNLKKENVLYFGSSYRQIYSVKDIKIGLLGYTGWSSSKAFTDSLKKDIKFMKTKCSLLVISFHWGSEYTNYPDETQKKLAHISIDYGADLVIGHHPHVIQGIERYKGRYIAYSLGNFCFGGNVYPKDYDTYIFQESFVFDSSGRLKECKKYSAIPCSISSISNKNNFKPTLLDRKNCDRVLKRLDLYSSKL